jgi:hypothetical protein
MTYLPLSNVTIQGQTQGTNPTTEVIGTNGNQSLNVCINDPRTAFNEIAVSQLTPLAQIDFVYGIATTITTSNTTGSNASVTASLGLLNVTSNGASGTSSALFNAKKFVKYRAGQGAQGRLTSLFSQPAKVNGSICVSGLGFAVANTTYPIDFIGFGYGNVSSCSQFGILWRRNKNDIFYPQSSWNFDKVDGTTKSGMTLNPQALNSWQIQFQYCANILLYLENPSTGRFILVHSIPTNQLVPTVPNFQNPTLQLMWYSNSASTSSNTLTCYGASGGHFLEGERQLTGPRGALVNNPPGSIPLNTETMIFALKNSTYYGAKQNLVIPNRSQIHLRGLTVSCGGRAGSGTGSNPYYSGPGVVMFKQIRNPTISAPTVWTPYSGGINQSGTDGSNIYGVSTVSSNVGQLTGIGGGNLGFTWTIPVGGGTSIVDLEPYESVLYPGDVICFTANVISTDSSTTVDFAGSITWQEDL